MKQNKSNRCNIVNKLGEELMRKFANEDAKQWSRYWNESSSLIVTNLIT